MLRIISSIFYALARLFDSKSGDMQRSEVSQRETLAKWELLDIARSTQQRLDFLVEKNRTVQKRAEREAVRRRQILAELRDE